MDNNSKLYQPGQREWEALLAARDRISNLYQEEDFQLILLPYLRAELSNKQTELLFENHSDYERGLIQGKAQSLYAIINLPNELREMKSFEELQQKAIKDLKYEEM